MTRARSVSTEADPSVVFVVDGPAPEQVIAGAPVTSTAVLDSCLDGAVLRGLWKMTPGAMSDVEADEMFVVLSGAATVEFVGTDEVWALQAGSVGVFVGGEHTIWRVSETLTKAFQVTDASAEARHDREKPQ